MKELKKKYLKLKCNNYLGSNIKALNLQGFNKFYWILDWYQNTESASWIWRSNIKGNLNDQVKKHNKEKKRV